MFVNFFIDRPIFASVLAIVIVVAGAAALPLLPIAQFPDITPPQVVVTATYPGASAEVVEQTVTTPIEQQVNGVENMIYMSSRSGSDGTMTLNVTFKVGTDLEIAAVNVQNRVAIAEAKLPADVVRQGLTITKQSPGPGRDRRADLAGREPRRALPVELRHPAGRGRAGAGAGRGAGDGVQRARLRHALLAEPRPADEPRPHRG